MADNVNPQAIRVANEQIRPLADFVGQVYNHLKVVSVMDAAQNWNSLFPSADPTGELVDGSRADGRTVVTNGDCQNVRAFVTSFVAFMEAVNNQRLNQVLKVAVNPRR